MFTGSRYVWNSSMMVKGSVLGIITTRVVNGWNYGETSGFACHPMHFFCYEFSTRTAAGRDRWKGATRASSKDPKDPYTCQRKFSGLRIFEGRSFDGHHRVCRIVVGGT